VERFAGLAAAAVTDPGATLASLAASSAGAPGSVTWLSD
jgi:hypothetical protein